MGGVGTNQKQAGERIELEWCNDVPCTPRNMIGTSWWKCMGYNTPCKCVHTFIRLSLDYQYQIVDYLHENYPESVGDN